MPNVLARGKLEPGVGAVVDLDQEPGQLLARR